MLSRLKVTASVRARPNGEREVIKASGPSAGMTTGAGDWWLPAVILGGGLLAGSAGLYLGITKPEARWARVGLVAIATLGALAALAGLIILAQSGM